MGWEYGIKVMDAERIPLMIGRLHIGGETAAGWKSSMRDAVEAEGKSVQWFEL